MTVTPPHMPTPPPQLWATGAPVEGRCWKTAGARAAVLLTHGFGEYLARYTHGHSQLISALLQAGMNVYGYDLRGHGQSLGPRGVVDVRALVADHLSAREQLRRQPLPVFAFGHSLGGLVTALSAARDPRGLSGLILSSPALLVGENENAAVKAAAPLLARLAPALPVSKLDPADISRLPEQCAAYEQDPHIYHGRVPALSGATMLSQSSAGWKLYPNLRLPTLVVHGTADRIADIRGSERFVRTIASDDKTLLTVEGGYHELLNDQGAAALLDTMLDWLRQRTPARVQE